MAFIPVPATAKVVVGMTLNGVSISNTLWFTKSTTFTAAQLDTLNEAVLDLWLEHVLPLQTSALTLNQIQSYDMTSVSGPVRTETAPPGSVGGVTDTPALPGQVALAMTFRTDNRGKSGRGRLYHAGLTEGQVGGNTVNSSVVALLLQAYGDVMSGVEAATSADHVVVSFQTEGEARLNGLPQLVTAITTDGRVDTQRRRLS